MLKLIPPTTTLASAALVLSALMSGCATAPTPEQRQSRLAGVSIHDHLRSSGNFRFAQDQQSHVVAHRSYKLVATGAFQKRRDGITGFEDHCTANGGRLLFDDDAGAQARAGLPTSQNRPLSTADLWRAQGIVSGDPAIMGAFTSQLVAQQAARQAVGFLFDSARRTESVGSFVCVDAASGTPRWWLFRELSNAHKGYVSDGGMYRFPDAYSVYFNETVLVYEKQSFKEGRGGYAPLPKDSDALIFPATGYHVVIEQRAAGWQVVAAAPYRSGAGSHRAALQSAPKRQNERQEIVVMSDDGRFAAPAYPDQDVSFVASDNDISRHLCHVDVIARKATYSLCTSAFVDAPREVGMARKLLARGPNALHNLGLSRTVSFQPDLFYGALDQAKAQAIVRQLAPSQRACGATAAAGSLAAPSAACP